MIGIYCITNKINQKKYIGQSKNIERRWKEELKGGCNECLFNDFKKYGLENFSFEVLEECCKEELDKKEREYIKKYNTTENGYNILSGGVGWKYPQKVCNKISNSLKEYYKNNGISEETKEKWKKSISKTDLSKSHSRAIICLETKEILSSQKEFIEINGYRPYKCLKFGKPDKNGNHWEYLDKNGTKKVKINKNKKYNPESSKKRMKKIQCVETGEIFNSIKEIKEKFGFDVHHEVDSDGTSYGCHWTTKIDYNAKISDEKPYLKFSKTLTQEEFISRVKEKFKNRYDFSNSIYVNTRSSIDFICCKHGKQTNLAKNLLKSNIPCRECLREERSKAAKSQWDKKKR